MAARPSVGAAAAVRGVDRVSRARICNACRSRGTPHLAEFRAYRPRRFPGTVSVFSSGDAPSEVCDPLPIWRRKARKVETYTIAGEHGAIMSRDNVDSVALEFSRCLGAFDGGVAPRAPRGNTAVDESGPPGTIIAAAVG